VFIPLMLLAVESASVMALRTVKLMAGDGAAMHEAHLMISEKVEAAFEASANLMAGASSEQIIDRYRQHVAINAKRLRTR
jgi:hypothetical protein